MKKHILIIMIAIIVSLIAFLIIVLLGGLLVNNNSLGPAPNSGDGVSDGSGLEQPNYKNDLLPEINQLTSINLISIFFQFFSQFDNC